MKRVSIFSPKGGSGKTTMTVLLSSWLSYHEGAKVCVMDFDSPMHHLRSLRESDLSLAGDPSSQLSARLREGSAPEPYDILTVKAAEKEVLDTVDRLSTCSLDYLLYDLPPGMGPEDPVTTLVTEGYIDFVAIPVDTDPLSVRSALVLADALRRCAVPEVLFWNRVSTTEASTDCKRLSLGAEPFTSRGFTLMDENVRELRTLSRDCSEMGFIRSTLCFPERHITPRCPSLLPFLECLRRHIDGAPSVI